MHKAARQRRKVACILFIRCSIEAYANVLVVLHIQQTLNTQLFQLQLQTERAMFQICLIYTQHYLDHVSPCVRTYFKVQVLLTIVSNSDPLQQERVNSLFFFEERSKFETTLTTACCVNSNVYGLHNIHWIRYLTPVDPILSTSSAVQTNHHVTSASVGMATNGLGGNSGFIWEKPVSCDRPISTSIRMMATGSEVS